MKKPILIVVAWYLPGYKAGGPIKSVKNIVSALGDRYAFHIVTGDRDFGDDRPFDSVPLDTEIAMEKTSIVYSSPSLLALWRHFREGCERAEICYLNSFFSPRFSIWPRLLQLLRLIPARTTIIAPRGEFSEGALALKAAKKRLFLFVARTLRLYDGVLWHAASPEEARDIAGVMRVPDDRIFLAPNIADPPAETGRAPSARRRGALSVVFVSRISRKKNVRFFIDTLKRCRGPLIADIYGPVEDAAYWEECREAMAAAPDGVTITYRGALKPEQVRGTLCGYDLFFLPTLGENFGHVVLEAMQAGLPVLLSDKTPWRDLQRHGVGADLPLADPEAFVGYIEGMQMMTASQRNELRQRVLAFSENASARNFTIESHQKMFNLKNKNNHIV